MTIDLPTARDIPKLRQLWQEAFGDTDAFLDGFFDVGFAPTRCRCIHKEDTLAAALYWFDWTWHGKKVAYIYAVATARDFRGQGLCRALMADTHRHLKQMGYGGIALVPAKPELFALYEKLGYKGFCPMEQIQVEAGAPAPLPQMVSAGEFQHRSLPENALVPDGITLAFLATYAKLYKLEGGSFAVSREGNRLDFQEFLTEPALLPGIVAALGGKTGVAYLPGGDTPFAMYRSLDHTDDMPEYLGIALS